MERLQLIIEWFNVEMADQAKICVFYGPLYFIFISVICHSLFAIMVYWNGVVEMYSDRLRPHIQSVTKPFSSLCKCNSCPDLSINQEMGLVKYAAVTAVKLAILMYVISKRA